jgi:PTH1 family peptidyl-tRNA hydrolase
MKIILGIGNPGEDYADTRHNCGFLVVDRLAARAGVALRRARVRARAARAVLGREPVLLVKPDTFVNLTGEVVPTLLREQEAVPADLLVVCDDLNLPLGVLRARAGGSAGGHHGLESVIEYLGGDSKFPRLRIGIGAPAGGGAVGHVLGRFGKAEQAAMEAAFDRAADASACWAAEGIQACMNKFNQRPEG